jgi:DNA-binding response OmpR family regulator
LLEAILIAAGNRVVSASDPRDVNALMARHSFDVIISDIVMPRKGGVEVIQELRRNDPIVGIIAMSGAEARARKLFLEAGRLFGADAVFEKPFRHEEILLCVADVLKRVWQRKREKDKQAPQSQNNGAERRA